MKTSFVITRLGTDRPGLVSAMAARAAACGANWMESNMAQLAGKFAGIVRLEIEESDAPKLEAALRDLEAEGLRLTMEQGAVAVAPGAPCRTALELVGQDRPGIAPRPTCPGRRIEDSPTSWPPPGSTLKCPAPAPYRTLTI